MTKEFGFKYEPGTEQEVCILFGLLMPYVDKELAKLCFNYSKLYLEEYPDTFPDCNLLMDDKLVKAEFELSSSNFKYHPFHDPKKCDLIICWKNDWLDCKLPVLELSKVILNDGERLPFILTSNPKYPDRGTRRWELEEFKKRLKDIELVKFVDGLSNASNISLQTGKGKKISTLNIGTDGITYPLAIEDRGKAYIAYYNVNEKPQKTLLLDEKIKMIRELLGESDRLPQPRQWHYIEAENASELVNKLVRIIEILTEQK